MEQTEYPLKNVIMKSSDPTTEKLSTCTKSFSDAATFAPKIDSEKIRAGLEQHGFAIARGALPSASVTGLRDKLLEMLAREGVCDGTSGRVLEERKENLERVILTARELAYSTPCFHDLANDSDLTMGMMRVLKTSELFVHPRRFIRVGVPHSLAPSLTTALHQDYRYVQGAIDTLTAWIPLGPCSQSNGTLMLFPGTHKRGLLPVTESSGNSFSFGVSSEGLPEPVFAEVDEGDVVIFHSLTLHGACPNCSDRVRLSMDVRFQRADDQLCASALLPPYITDESDTDPSVWSKDPYYRPPIQAQLIPATGHLDVEAPSTSSLFTR